jgi:hypothetical protein
VRLELSKEQAEKIRLWILVPAAGDLIHATFSQCLNKLFVLLGQHRIQTQMMFLPGDSLVTRARNNLAHLFYKSSTNDETDFCLWLDCDILFEPEAVLQMLALNLDFVTAPYSKKALHQDRIAESARLNLPNDRMMASAGTPNVNWLAHPIRCDVPMPVLEAGSGFWLTKRKVYTQMIESLDITFKRCNDEKHYGDEGYDFFRVGIWPETKEYLSEDWWFCREWRKLGGTVYCCFWVKTNHIGPYLYPMDMPAIADLLTATGGYINAETKPNATTQIRPVKFNSGAADPLLFRDGDRGSDASHVRPDILRAVAAARDYPRPTDEAAGEGDSGPMGG